MCLYKKNPTAYLRARFKLPVWAMTVLPLVSLMIYTYGAYLSFVDFISTQHLVALVVYSSLAILYAKWREKVVLRTAATQA
jgi:hypothetical protein